MAEAPFTTDDFKRIANGKDVIVCEEEANGYKIKRIYSCNCKITKLKRQDERLIESETWNDGKLSVKVLRYENRKLKITRRVTATKVTEEIKYKEENDRVVKHEYSRNDFNVKNMESFPTSIKDIAGDRSELKEYRMSNPLGFCVIINNEFSKTYLERKSIIDKKKLYAAWTKLGFKIKLVENKNCEETREAFFQIANDPQLKNYSCFVMMILSHGDSDSMSTNDNEKIHLSKVFDAFNEENCVNLRGKPKIFGIDICREYKSVECAPINDYWQQTVAEVDNLAKKQIDKPVYNDMIISYGTCSGRKSICDNSSWYIDSLCKTLQKYGKEHEIADLLRIVDYYVSTKRTTNNLDQRQNTEIKFIGVNRRLYFRPNFV